VTALLPQPGTVLRATPSALTAVFWDACADKTLLFQRCQSCGAPQFDPADRCRACLGDELRWEASNGRGVVTTWTVVWRPVVPSYVVPYAPVVVRLEEGFHIVSNVVGCDHADVRTGLRVAVAFHADEAGVVLPYFEPDPRPERNAP
jgi:uncharacterized OB-fold protein